MLQKVGPLATLTIATASLFGVALWPAEALADDTSDCIAASEAAQTSRDSRALLDAKEKLAICSRDVCPGPIRADCIDLGEKVEAATPSVVFRAKGAHGEDVVDVKVFCDGAPLASQIDGRALRVDPGAHTFRFEETGNPPIERKILVSEGEKNRLVVIEMSPAAPAAPAPNSEKPRGFRLSIPGLVVGAVGVVATIPMAAFWLAGTSDVHQMRDTCAPSAGGAGCPSDRVDSDRTKLIVGDVFLGVAVAGITTGAVLLVTHGLGHKTQEASDAQLRMTFAPTAGGAVAGAVGRF